MSWAEGFLDWTEATFEPFGVAGILVALFAIAYLESSFFPIPPDLLILTFVLNWPELFLAFALVATVGSVLGGLLGYWIGERGGRPLLLRLSRPERVARAEAYFEKWGAWAVGIAGFSPIPYKVFTITAGALRMDKRTFIEASLLSRGARFFLEATLLYIFQEELRDFMLGPYFNLATLLGVMGLVAVLWGRSKLVERREAAEAAWAAHAELLNEAETALSEDGDDEREAFMSPDPDEPGSASPLEMDGPTTGNSPPAPSLNDGESSVPGGKRTGESSR